MFQRRRVHVHLRTLRDGCVHTFWLMKSCLCVTLNISHLVCHTIFHRCTRNKVPHHDFLTYEPFSLCNIWLTRASPWANCHIWGRVCLKRVTKFLKFYLDHHVSTQCVDYKTCSCACSHTKRRVCVGILFWRMKSCLCVTLNISHLVCHIIFHRCTSNKVPHHDFLTYEPFSLCNFWLTRTSSCANCHIGRRDSVQLTT